MLLRLRPLGAVLAAVVLFTVLPGADEARSQTIQEIINSTGDGMGKVLTGPSQSGLAVDSQNNVYVTAVTSKNVFRISAAGVVSQIDDVTNAPNGYYDVIVDAADNVFYNIPGGKVFRRSSGVTKMILDVSASQNLRGMAIDANGVLYQTAGNNNPISTSVYRIANAAVCDLEGGTACETTEIIDETAGGLGVFRSVQDVVVDPVGNVYAVEESGGSESSVWRIDNPVGCSTSGPTMCTITEISNSGGTIHYPVQLGMDTSGNLFVADRGDNNGGSTAGVWKIANPDVCSVSGPTVCTPTNVLTMGATPNLYAIATGPFGNVFVANYTTHDVWKIEPGGTVSKVLDSTGGTDKAGTGTAGLSQPLALAVNAAGDLYASGSGSHNVFGVLFDYQFLDFGDLPAGNYASVTVLPDGARHEPVGPLLGTLRDGELDGFDSSDAGFAAADGDDGTDDADEDGVSTSQADPEATVFAEFIGGSTVSVDVELNGASEAYLQVWLDGAGDGFDADPADRVVTDDLLSEGSNSVSIDIPSSPVTATGLRFRVTSYSDASGTVLVDGYESDGEVEDYLIDIVTSGDISLDVDGGSIVLDGTDVVYTDAAGNEVLRVLATSLTGLTLEGTSGDDEVTFDWGLVEAIEDITINLGDGFDTLVIEEGGVVLDNIAYDHTDANSGTITDGDNTVAFNGLDPIIDNLDVANREFTFSASDEIITLSADGDGASGNDTSFIDSGAAEEVSFLNPTASVTINTGDGYNAVVLGLLDTDLDAGFSDVAVNGGADADTFYVTPATYPVDIDGAGEGIGECDGLRLDLSGGAIVDVFTNVAGTGSYTFSTGEATVTFTDIEAVGDTDLELSVNYETLYATQDLTTVTGNELVVTVTNSGVYDANCVTVTFSAALASFLNGSGTAVTAGSFSDPTWTIDTVPAGGEVTLTITGFVAPPSPQNISVSMDAVQDTNDENNAASIELTFGFLMPAKAHVNSALYYSKPASPGDYDALIVGLFQGSPGIDGAVWCKVPDATVAAGAPTWPPALFPAGVLADTFRPCSAGLPFPLHVNDLYQDVSGTLWLATWGYDGLYKSEDGGESWTGVDPLDTGFTIVYTIIEDSAGGILYASVNNGLVLRSLNDGVSWQQVSSLPGVASDTPFSMVAHPSLSGTLYAGTHGNGVFVTEDYGFTWAVLEDGASENNDLITAKAAHIFDLEFAPDDEFLFAGTGNGVWRADLSGGTATGFTGTWTSLGPDVTLDDASVVTPEIRTLAFVDDGVGGLLDDLVGGSWGFGAFLWGDPTTSDVSMAMTLRQGHVTFVAAAPDGQIFVGTSEGETALLSAADATSTATEPVQMELPEGYALGQNYPNPFNPVTTIGFALPETGRVKLSVFDGLGREVAVLVDGTIEAGNHEARFDAKSLPTGAYLYRLSTDAGSMVRTLVLMK